MNRSVCAEVSGKRKFSFLRALKLKIISFILRTRPKLECSIAELLLQEGSLSLKSFYMLNNILKFSDCTVKDIMIPRSEVYAIDFNTEKSVLINNIVEGQHTRVPIYKNNLDNIVGFVHIKDVLSNLRAGLNLKDIIRDIIFIPDSMKAINLFIKMQASHKHVAIVLDEYGGTEGLVTMEDIIEEIVGNIDDEHDAPSVPEVVKISPDRVEVTARVLVKTLEEFLNINLREDDDEDYVTVGGLVLSMIGRVPAKEEILQHKSGAVFIIKEANDRCIHKILIDLSSYRDQSSE